MGFVSLGSSRRRWGDKMGRHFRPASAARKGISDLIGTINRETNQLQIEKAPIQNKSSQKSLKPISKYFDIGFLGC